ncbi:DMT family transporter [Streptococcus mutans]|uniref:DMT family transporter n=1 Tax=Streptococcus mutans TaxID=1309 RepID=UPI0002B5EC0D|nr:DMT family transporter [Streptococcus mutans]EMB83869.1 putative integral membrane protein [Streptococcus mutans A9]MCB4929554.1 DMT family transporter [Streptococcus mutans]MCB5007195.1 DMT family transporter [Streptococcus mutans]MCB5029492.1 DMT family transporter [Streptococcus mutans]MCB5036465.1 DMT family transporter [Streptococcus mutans]
MKKSFKGTVLVVLAAIAWGISGVSGQFLMKQGISVYLLTSLRLLISGLLLIGVVIWQQPQQVKAILEDKKVLAGIFGFSICGLLLNQFSYLQAIHYTNAGTATVLQYMAPVLVLTVICFRDRSLPTMGELTAILLAILGTFVIATHGQMGNLALSPVGLFWGLFSAVTYTLYMFLPIKLIQEWGSLLVIGLGMLLGGLVFSLVSQSWQYNPQFQANNLLAYVGLIIVGSVFAYTSFLKGVSLIGAVKGSLLASIEPVAAVFFSVAIMKEIFYPIDFLGMLLTILAVLIISVRDLLAVNKEKI